MLKKIFYLIIRIIIAFGLLTLLFKKLNLKESFNLIFKLNLFFYLLSLFLILIFQFISVYRWQYTLKINNLNLNFWKLLKIHFISIFLQNFLPTTFGQDIVKGALTFKNYPKIRVASSLIISRICGIFVLLIFANLSLIFIKKSFYNLKNYSLIFILLYTALLFLLFNKNFQYFLIKLYNRINLKFFKKLKIEIFFEKINVYKEFNVFFVILILSALLNFILILYNWILFLSFGVNINLKYFLLYIPIITFITFLPISIGGLGIRENLYYYFFKSIVNENLIGGCIILFLFNLILFSLPGAIFLIFREKDLKK